MKQSVPPLEQADSVKLDARPLNDAERRVLGALLEPEFDGVGELRLQAAAVQVVGGCDCGCPTVDLRAGGPPASALRQRRLSPVEGRIAPQDDEPPGEILLFLEEGRIVSMEYVSYTDQAPAAWPAPDRVTVVGGSV